MSNSFYARILLVVAIAGSWALARSKGKGDLPGVATGDGVNIVRLIHAAESDYFREQGRYATFGELIQSGQIQRTSEQSTEYSQTLHALQLQPDLQPLAGFTLNLIVSPGGNGFQLSLKQRGSECGVGWFTDETGVLYGGKVLNCPERSASVVKSWNATDIDASVPPTRRDIPCPLPRILREASQRATELVQNLQRFTATEQIEHTEFGKSGKPRKSRSEEFSYVAEIEQSPRGGFWIEEYRTAKSESEPPPLIDIGSAAMALIFHPKVIDSFEISCEGRTDHQGRPAWQVRFVEGPDPSRSFSALRIKDRQHQVRFKGRAWIAADDYEVLRMQTDLVAPMPEINLQLEHFDISYAPVEFAKHKFRIWLPESASMQISYRGRRYERVHSFSHFQLFLVDTDQRVKEPVAGPGAGE
jgi:hypothetical protein